MILNHDDFDPLKMTGAHDDQNAPHDDTLPTYDMATGQSTSSGPFNYESTTQAKGTDVKVHDNPPPPVHPSRQQPAHTTPMMSPPSGPYMPPTTVYNYINPETGARVTSLLPPDHPQMICLQEGRHIAETKFGLLGILAAVFWFPLGIGLCLLDRKVKCRRCGLIIDDGLC